MRLVGQKSNRERRLGSREAETSDQHAEMVAHAKPGATWQDQEDAREGCRDGNRGEDEQEPDDGSRHRQQPAEDDGHQSGRRKQRAP